MYFRMSFLLSHQLFPVFSQIYTQGLSHNDKLSDIQNYPAASSPFSYLNNHSSLIQSPGGLREQGTAKDKDVGPYAGESPVGLKEPE